LSAQFPLGGRLSRWAYSKGNFLLEVVPYVVAM
jgi:hypothetical protein